MKNLFWKYDEFIILILASLVLSTGAIFLKFFATPANSGLLDELVQACEIGAEGCEYMSEILDFFATNLSIMETSGTLFALPLPLLAYLAVKSYIRGSAKQDEESSE